MRVAQKTFDIISRTLQAGFSVIEETHFKFERLESRMDFAVIAPRNNFAVITKINLRMLGRSGELFVVIPQTALNPIRQSLSRDLSNDVSAPDPRWSKHIHTEVGRAEVTVQAIIEEDGFTLGDIADLKVGNILQLKATPNSRVKLECNRSRCSGASSARRKANIRSGSMTSSMRSRNSWMGSSMQLGPSGAAHARGRLPLSW